MSSKSILIILSYTVSKLVRCVFSETQCTRPTTTIIQASLAPRHVVDPVLIIKSIRWSPTANDNLANWYVSCGCT